MSVLTAKNVLVVGDEIEQVRDLESALKAEGATIHVATCSSATPDLIAADDIDIVFLNHLHEGALCVTFLNTLRESRLEKVLPIFALVENEPAKIEHALMLGAADYFTPQEPVDSIMRKMRLVLGEPSTASTGASIDITPKSISLKKTGIKVFLVEDDPLLRNLLAIRLEQSFFPFEACSDGTQALAAMKQFLPDIIILDLMLPGRSGFDILQDLRKDPALKDVPVIVFSNRDGPDDRARAAALGANKFFVKAMTDLSELVLTIEALVQ